MLDQVIQRSGDPVLKHSIIIIGDHQVLSARSVNADLAGAHRPRIFGQTNDLQILDPTLKRKRFFDGAFVGAIIDNDQLKILVEVVLDRLEINYFSFLFLEKSCNNILQANLYQS